MCSGYSRLFCRAESAVTPVFSQMAINMTCATKKTLKWCRSLYISMKLANNAMHDCIFDICKTIMFTVRADHHGTSTRFNFHIRLKHLCSIVTHISTIILEQVHKFTNSWPAPSPKSNQILTVGKMFQSANTLNDISVMQIYHIFCATHRNFVSIWGGCHFISTWYTFYKHFYFFLQ